MPFLQEHLRNNVDSDRISIAFIRHAKTFSQISGDNFEISGDFRRLRVMRFLEITSDIHVTISSNLSVIQMVFAKRIFSFSG